MLGNSNSQPVLSLTGLIAGDFLFDLTVGDASNAKNTTTVYLKVLSSDELLNSVEMYLDKKESDITYRLRAKLETRISATILSQVPLSHSYQNLIICGVILLVHQKMIK